VACVFSDEDITDFGGTALFRAPLSPLQKPATPTLTVAEGSHADVEDDLEKIDESSR
jgi:hypothetical protein|tara:strand:+ start:94 stop:264 length:171 start_codon:yes stop_codon:yes gene_type:complete